MNVSQLFEAIKGNPPSLDCDDFTVMLNGEAGECGEVEINQKEKVVILGFGPDR